MIVLWLPQGISVMQKPVDTNRISMTSTYSECRFYRKCLDKAVPKIYLTTATNSKTGGVLSGRFISVMVTLLSSCLRI